VSTMNGWLVRRGVRSTAPPDSLEQVAAQRPQGRARKVAIHPIFSVVTGMLILVIMLIVTTAIQ
jgi:hypothetical protein